MPDAIVLLLLVILALRWWRQMGSSRRQIRTDSDYLTSADVMPATLLLDRPPPFNLGEVHMDADRSIKHDLVHGIYESSNRPKLVFGPSDFIMGLHG